jgi:hypothetical protein
MGYAIAFPVSQVIAGDRVPIGLEFICSLPCHRQPSNLKRIHPTNIELYELYREQFNRGY